MPDFGLLDKLLQDSSLKQGLVLVKIVIVACLNPTKLMHDECGPSPSPSSLDAIPKLVLAYYYVLMLCAYDVALLSYYYYE